MEMYHFITTWKIEAPLENVWDAIYKAEEWPAWWPAVSSVKPVKDGDANDIGSVKEYKWTTKFGYRLCFKSELVEIEKHKTLKGIAWGELEGDGTWVFSEEKGITTAIYYWNVRTTKKWMNLLSPILKPVFNLNHHLVMDSGAKGLAKKLGARLISY